MTTYKLDLAWHADRARRARALATNIDVDTNAYDELCKLAQLGQRVLDILGPHGVDSRNGIARAIGFEDIDAAARDAGLLGSDG